MPDEILILIFEAVHGGRHQYSKGHLILEDPDPNRKKARTRQNIQPQILVEPKKLQVTCKVSVQTTPTHLLRDLGTPSLGCKSNYHDRISKMFDSHAVASVEPAISFSSTLYGYLRYRTQLLRSLRGYRIILPSAEAYNLSRFI